jgi:filamentous hemagglutinin family protein
MSEVSMGFYRWHLGIAIGSVIILYANSSVAQITPDGTLPNNSNVRLEDNIRIISGGTTRGANLFHSFSEFSIPSSSTALFNNAPDIQNIISRVTGKSTSEINGLIKSNDTANLFLINPNGIVFGKNASLNIGGSFVATTANAVGFGQNGFFSASNPEAPSPLLTVNPNALLFNQITAAPIQNSSTAPAGQNPAGFEVFGLRVKDGNSLLLVGGNVNMDGGQLNAYGGRVELGGLTSTGTLALGIDGNNFRLGFPNESTRADVSLANKSNISVQSGGGGSIAVNARNLEVSGGSVVSAGIGNGLGTANSVAGDIMLNATGEIKVSGAGSYVFNRVRPQALGNGGNLTITTKTLSVWDGAQVATGTFGAGESGNLRVNADTVSVIGGNTFDGSSSKLTTQNQGAIGNAGDLTIATKTLLVQDGGQISTGTFGVGKGGNLTVNADTVQLIGSNTVDGSPSGLFANADRGATGNGGNITISSNELRVQDGALVFAGARAGIKSPSNGGVITITTQKLLLQNGGGVGTGTRGVGRGGNVNIKADTIQMNGFGTSIYSDTDSTGDGGNVTIDARTLIAQDGAQVSVGTADAGKGGNLTVNADTVQVIGAGTSAKGGRFRSGLFTSTRPNSTGAAGDLKINAQELFAGDKAGVFVNSFGFGNAGNLWVNARSVRLDNGILSADTRSINTDPNKPQANITLQVKDLLLLRRGSNITANATGENVIGGDININTNILAGFQNSDITANSDDFRGGNVRINTKSLFGIQFRDVASLITSDITASGGTRELSGNVEITTPDLDPSRGLIELPVNLVDASSQISNACTPGSQQSQNSFVATGRSGLPVSPTEPLQENSTFNAWVTLTDKPETTANTTIQPQPTVISNTPKVTATPIVEASSWIVSSNGNIELVASASQAPYSSWYSVSCSQ